MNAREQHGQAGRGVQAGMVPPDDVHGFLRSWTGVAATLIDRHLNVAGSTPLAEALFPQLQRGENLARVTFLGEQTTCSADMSAQVVAALHASLASHEEDAGFRQIVGELSARSREFSTAWAADRVGLQPHGTLRTIHATAGELSISYQLLALASGSDEVLIVWRGADPESETALRGLDAAS